MSEATMAHCPGCDGILPQTYQPKRDNDVPCPGVTCPACQDKDAEIAKLRAHYDAAGPEHNLLALLDLYHEREMEARAECERLRALVAVGREMANLAKDVPLITRVSEIPVDRFLELFDRWMRLDGWR